MVITIKRPGLRDALREQVQNLLSHEFGRDLQRIRSMQVFGDGRVVYFVAEVQYGTYFEQIEMVWERNSNGKWNCLWDEFTGNGGYRLPVGKLSMHAFCEFLKESVASS